LVDHVWGDASREIDGMEMKDLVADGEFAVQYNFLEEATRYAGIDVDRRLQYGEGRCDDFLVTIYVPFQEEVSLAGAEGMRM
jgi:hypothetical protein